MSWDDFLGWVAFAELEPFEGIRADFRAASIVKALWDVNLKPSQRKKIHDYVLRFDMEPKSKGKSAKELALVAKAIAEAHNTA